MSGDTAKRMAEIVRAEPTITVRELAQRLGFAEEGSVYYWLRKSGHSGLRSFKKAVLKGPGVASSFLRQTGPDAKDQKGLQFTPSSTQEKKLRYGIETWTVESTEYRPWILPGDCLEIECDVRPKEGDLVLIELPGEQGEKRELRRYYDGRPALLVHPADGKKTMRVDPHRGWAIEGRPARLVGCVRALRRKAP